MAGQPRIEELVNKIIFLRKALEYYASQKTYACNQGVAPIDQDRGHQARFALKQSDDIEKYNQELIDEYVKNINIIKEQMDGPEVSEEELNKLESIEELIKKYKHFK